MAKRLRMTGADYVAIAISPALIMALVGSLVYFLIEVFYAGDYQVRLNYAFALFVFAAVLIARISIETGSERAAIFALPLGLAMFAVLVRFVEHPSPMSPLMNLALIGVVWWCAHKLTWDCTLIDDNEDASGEGLLQRIGVDEASTPREQERAAPWWHRLTHPRKGPHTPGLWVLYFSLAALPLFGVGQAWVPASEVGRRQYVFALLLVYVFSALALLVTTSFLGLRRYLRQRHLEMPAPMAATWVGIGAVVTVIVMLFALVLPRPAAEVAISQPPWQARSPGGLSPARYAVGHEGVTETQPGDVVSRSEDGPEGDAVDSTHPSPVAGEGGDSPDSGDDGQRPANQQASDAPSSDPERRAPADQQGRTHEGQTAAAQRIADDAEPQDATSDSQPAETDGALGRRMVEHADPVNPLRLPQQWMSPAGLAGLLKLLLYAAIALLAAYFLWKHRRQLMQALADIVRAVRELLSRLFGGGRSETKDAADDRGRSTGPRRRTFAEFRDPFAAGRDERMTPEQLVRYTFEAFEAWAADHGTPRTADQTPLELLHSSVAPQAPLYPEARRLVRLYSELAYASGDVPREASARLSELWRLMRAASPVVVRAPAAPIPSDD